MSLCVEEQINKVLQLGSEGNLLEAAVLCNQILENDSQNAQVLTLLGLLKYKNNQVQDGIACIEKALEIKPTARLYLDLGRIHLEQNDFRKMEECCEYSIKFDSENFDAWFYYALALKTNEKIDVAIKAYEKAIQINPDACNAYHNLGNIYFNIKNDSHSALKYYKKYLEYDSDNKDAKSCIGTLYLKMKNYKEGWKYLEFSENNENAVNDRNALSNSSTKFKPHWEGEDLNGKTIYVYYSGGYGDTIMFSRFLPMLNARGAKVLFRPYSNCIKLFTNNELKVTVLDENDLENELEFDYHIPMMRIPNRLKIWEEKDIPSPAGYIKANPEKSKFYKEKYFDNKQFKIGIKWQGFEDGEEDRRKIKLQEFCNLFDLPNTKFYSLQKDDGIEQLTEVSKFKIIDLGSTFNDFEDTAAAIENLDLVISNDTSVAHLAGAMGKHCWVLLPFVQDWRWSDDLSYTPWYKSVTLFKQTKIGDWAGVFEQVYDKLNGLLQ